MIFFDQLMAKQHILVSFLLEQVRSVPTLLVSPAKCRWPKWQQDICKCLWLQHILCSTERRMHLKKTMNCTLKNCSKIWSASRAEVSEYWFFNSWSISGKFLHISNPYPKISEI